jgi:hypothetical protein
LRAIPPVKIFYNNCLISISLEIFSEPVEQKFLKLLIWCNYYKKIRHHTPKSMMP